MRLFVICVCFVNLCACQLETEAPSLASLEETSAAWWEAWRTGDFETVMALEGEALGFGYRTAEPRILMDVKAAMARRQAWFKGLTELRFEPITRSYQVMGTTGLEWGTYTEEQHRSDGTVMKRQGRYTMTYVWSNQRWRIAIYHRSTLPEKRSVSE